MLPVRTGVGSALGQRQVRPRSPAARIKTTVAAFTVLTGGAVVPPSAGRSSLRRRLVKVKNSLRPFMVSSRVYSASMLMSFGPANTANRARTSNTTLFSSCHTMLVGRPYSKVMMMSSTTSRLLFQDRVMLANSGSGYLDHVEADRRRTPSLAPPLSLAATDTG
ncbi:hypothetical protein INR49_007512 [Caranx melampygus]|nr:hypothetical protein INR49_007512 [Caranx melampygus]